MSFSLTILGNTADELRDKLLAAASMHSLVPLTAAQAETVTTGKGRAGKKGADTAPAGSEAPKTSDEVSRATGGTGTVVPPKEEPEEEDDGLGEEATVTSDDVKPFLIELKSNAKFAANNTLSAFIKEIAGVPKLGDVAADKLSMLLAATKKELAKHA